MVDEEWKKGGKKVTYLFSHTDPVFEVFSIHLVGWEVEGLGESFCDSCSQT